MFKGLDFWMLAGNLLMCPAVC